MNRRQFLRRSGGGLVATATMAEAGLLSEFLSWLRRKPVSIAPPAGGWPVGTVGIAAQADADAAVVTEAMRVFFSRDGLKFSEIPGLRSLTFSEIPGL